MVPSFDYLTNAVVSEYVCIVFNEHLHAFLLGSELK